MKYLNYPNCSLAFLDDNAKGMVNQKGGQWSPLLSYRNSLAQQDDKEEGTKNKLNKNHKTQNSTQLK